MEGRWGLLFGLIVVMCFHGNNAQGTVCTQEAVADIVFLVDGSWSIGTKNFEQIRQFLYTLVNSFDIGPDHVRIGLVQYSYTPRTEFLLNTYQNREDILQAITQLPYMGGGTMTGKGLDFMLKNHFVEAAGSRSDLNVPQIAVVITDGKSQDDVGSYADNLKRKGIVLYAIGIKDADEEELKEMATEPHSQHVYSVSDFTALQGISQSIVQTLCTTVDEAKRQVQQLSKECAKATMADIVFLVDGSSSIGIRNFDQIRQFLRSVISGLDIGPNKVRVGLAQYSDEPYQEFLLNEHMDVESLLDEVNTFPYRTGDTETGKAINFLRTEYFTEKAGSRLNQRVPQIAVVITDGESRDDVVAPAQALRQLGVIVFGIGVGQAKIEELQAIANRPLDRFMFPIDSFEALQRLTGSLLQTVCVSMEDQRQALAEKFADIFFLVDSGISATDFQQVRTVLTRLSNQLNIGASAHRLGLAQYGQDTKVEFLFNAYETKEEIQNAIRRFRIRRLQPNEKRNLGSALQYANDRVFNPEAGSRAEEGFRQFLVVISGKDSDDDVYQQSRLIRSEGVTVVGMTLSMAMRETRLVATPPHVYRFNINAVQLLKNIFEKDEMEVDLTEDCKAAYLADIVFIVDESGSIGTTNFNLMRSFLHSVVSGLEIGVKRVQVGIVMYSDKPTAQVYLDTFDKKNELLNFIRILPYHGGGTNTGAALKFTRENVFIKSRGSRIDKGIQQVAVVITDGESQDNVSTAAADLRRAGVTVYAVGVKDANKDELKQMATHPPSKHMFSVDSFAKLKPLELILQKMICYNIHNEAVSTVARRSGIKEGCKQTDEADIYFLIDHSGSIYPSDFYDMKKFIIEFISTFRIGPQHVRMGVAKYADSPNLEFDLSAHSNAVTLEKAVEGIKQIGGGTETGRALEFMSPLFDQAMATRGHKVPEYLVVITDGKSSDEVKAPAEKLRSQGIILYAIGVKNADETELKEIAGDPKRTFFVNNFDALKPIKDDIITDICSQDVCKDLPGDLVFLIDSSGSIYPHEYDTMKEFMKSVISRSIIGQDDVHVGVMQFSVEQNLEFRLNEYFTKEEMSRAIDGMRQLGGGTHTGEAITAVSQYFEVARGGRPDLRQRLVVITDGEAQDEVKGPAAALRAKGVVIYAIGVVDANATQLLEISGSSDKMFSERNFDALKDLESKVALELCHPTDCKKTEKADIIFLVDGSKSVRDNFESMQKFMQAMVNQTAVGPDLTRFGVIVYSTAVKSVFTLNQYDSKRKVSNAIAQMQPLLEDTYTAKALEYSLQYFRAVHGGRAELKVPQILMVITDGDATDYNRLVPPSEALKKNGISVFSVGVKDAIQEQLEIMAGHDKSKVFFVDDFKALETLYQNITQILCNFTKPVCEKQKADLVFLIDQSGSINQADYSIMKNFTIEVMSSFNISKDMVRIGLAQFSNTFQDEFYLSNFYSQEEASEHILKMWQRGGGTKIGAALRSIRTYFEASQGSRRSEGISQNLVVITDGDSEDDVEDPADVLKDLGVEMFAIGIGKTHNLQLLQMTGTPERVFTVRDFESLKTIKDKVVKTICESKPIEEQKSKCSIDIAMGFEISQRSGLPGELLISHQTKLQTFLPHIAHYISMVQGLCCVGTIQTNLAYGVVGRDGRFLHDFSFESYNEDVVNKVMRWSLTEPTYFNTNLLQAFRKKFEAESKGNVKVLVIFSDGLDEDVMRLEKESDLLRKSGISALLTVALEGVRDPAQLQMVEFGRGFGYKLPLSIGMPSVGSAILKQIDSVSDRECCGVMCKCVGHEGVRGLRGIQGSKGAVGQKGYPGFPGEEGVAGERGFPGPSGPQGFQGCSGVRGLKGNRGLRGDRGEDGEDGLNGINGEQGVKGQDGGQGQSGNPGNPGIPGIRGEAGHKGERGLRGDPGEAGRENTSAGAKGEPGNPGLPGSPGADGGSGEGGVVGDEGPEGRRGPPGPKGRPGPPGSPGLEGSPGSSGPQGTRGARGQPGPRGVVGFPGPQGASGGPGNPGSKGRRGVNGQKGQPGDPGDKGAAGPLGPRGMPGQDGRDGYGPKGTKGVKGDPGFPGYPGLLGEEGVKGSKGYPGRKGNLGRGGNSGLSGESGVIGDPGHPGHRGPRGPPGTRDMTECQLITYIRDNCACCIDRSLCPALPTELVFGLDMSDDVREADFERQRSALLSLLENVNIAESNCPNGARVAVVGFNTYTKYLIRFQDYHRKAQLIDAVKNIALERTSNKRHLGASMRFVGQHIFKRIRSGVLTRKVAVFFSSGPSQNVEDVITAMMEYRALNIIPAVISTRNAPAIRQAMEVDDSGKAIFTVLRTTQDQAADLRRVKNCAICYDPCRPSEECSFIQEPLPPQQVEVDLALVLDSSREMQADEYTGAQQLLSSVVEQLVVSPQPRRVTNGARVALVQQSGTTAPKVEFNLQDYQSAELISRHLFQNMRQQGGSSALGQTLEYTLAEVLSQAVSTRRRRRTILTVVGTKTAWEDRAKLNYISQKAICDGVAVFVVAVGDRYDQTQVEQLAGLPKQQHLITVSRMKEEEQGYVQRFFRVFLSALNKGVFSYPPPVLRQKCEQLRSQRPVFVGSGQEEYEEQRRGQTEQVDISGTLIRGDGQIVVSEGNFNAWCHLDVDMGIQCGDYVQLWFFDSNIGACSPFWYGGCGGNANRFNTEHECFHTCGANHSNVGLKTELASFSSKDACLLRQDQGDCQNYVMMWFFDTEQGECTRFWYGGCGGNKNRFKTQDECESLCLMKSR